MKNLCYLLTLCIGYNLNAQSEILDANQVRTQINTNGDFFNQATTNRASYEVPKMNGTGPDMIFASTFWFGALDQSGALYLSDSHLNLLPGPIAYDYSSQIYNDTYNHIYMVTASQIHDHQINWNDVNYTMPNDILNWPGNGNTSNGEANILAPFVDYNANNIYEPNLGDHPVIRGDKSAYFILNDLAESRDSTQASALGMEFHFMVYQYATPGFLDSTTFINIKAVNRSQNSYNQFITTNYTDFDIGSPDDDYIGCSSDKDMIFGYNGDLNDNSSSNGSPNWGTNPPSCGIKLLSHNSGAASYFNNGGLQGYPTTALGFWNYMNGNWPDGTSFTDSAAGYGGTTPTNYVFDGNPNDTTLWTEVTELFSPGDRRAFMASEPIDNFAPGDFICYDYAVLYSRTGGNNLLNVNGLFDVADSAQAFYDAQPYFYCETVLLSDLELKLNKNGTTIYPNPSNGQFKVNFDGVYNLSISDINGKLVYQKDGNTNQSQFNLDLPNGVYIVEIDTNQKTNYTKLIINQ